jgi:hypothetical protein
LGEEVAALAVLCISCGKLFVPSGRCEMARQVKVISNLENVKENEEEETE